MNWRDSEGKTALHTAARKGYEECVKLLLLSGSEPNAEDDINWTPLHEATSEGEPCVAQSCRRAVLIALIVGNLVCMEILLENGANVELGDKDGCTALHLAARCGDVGCLRLLIEVLQCRPIPAAIYLCIANTRCVVCYRANQSLHEHGHLQILTAQTVVCGRLSMRPPMKGMWNVQKY